LHRLTSIAVMPTVRITTSGRHAHVLTGVLGLMLAGITSEPPQSRQRMILSGAVWLRWPRTSRCS